MVSPHLNIQHVADTAMKAPVMNEQTDLLDRALNQVVVIDVSAGGQIDITDTQAKENILLRLIGAPGGPMELVMPADQRFFGVHNQTSDASTITVGVASTSGTWDTIAGGEKALFHCDGENCIKIASTAGDDAGLVESFSGFIEVPEEKTYTLEQFAKVAYVINDFTAVLAAGGLTAQIEIDGTPVTGLDPVVHTTGESTDAATAANLVSVGDTVTMVVTDLDTGTAADFAFSMQITRT